MRTRAGPRRGDPHAGLEQHVRSRSPAGRRQRLEHVAVDRPAHECLTAGELPVDPRPVPRQRVLLVPAPLLGPQVDLRQRVRSSIADRRRHAQDPRLPSLAALALAAARGGWWPPCPLAGQHLGEEPAGVRLGRRSDLLRACRWRSAVPPSVAALGPRSISWSADLDHVEVVLDHDDRVARRRPAGRAPRAGAGCRRSAGPWWARRGCRSCGRWRPCAARRPA